MFLHNTGRADTGHIDLQGKPERPAADAINGAHLNEIRQRLLLEPAALNEARVAWATEIHPFLTGARGIARWTHQHKETVQELAGPDGGLSRHKFLYTATRGRSSVIEEEREDMNLRFNSLAGRSWSWSPDRYRSFAAQSLSKISIPSSPLVRKIMEEGKAQRGNGRETTGVGEDLAEALILAEEEFERVKEWGTSGSWSRNLMTALDPAADTWAEDASVEGLGKHAWRLAVLFGVQDIIITQRDLMALTGLAERPVRRLLERWKASPQSWIFELKVGRAKVYVLAFFQLLDPSGMLNCGHWTRKDKLYAAQARDAKERATAARRGTPEGAIAWKACGPRTRQAFLDELPQDADPRWRELVEAGDERACHTYLVEQAQDAGSVPSTPEALGDPVEVEPAEGIGLSAVPELHAEGRDRFACMRARVLGTS
ncbi:hypothetical protein [Streptomyces sp. NPDC021020]|uniref:hypothetical protein n=1 Tax=Streptomyces sp. NPDC021020 TaxID=3365109 RepID=UPI00378B220A